MILNLKVRYTILTIIIVLVWVILTLLFISSKSSASLIPVHQQTNLTCKVSEVTLPIIFSDHYAGVTEVEPNNTTTNSTGPLLPGIAYSGTFEEITVTHVDDYFRFYLPSDEQLVVSLNGTNGTTDDDLATKGTQLILYYREQDYKTTPLLPTIIQQPHPTYEISHDGKKGWYIIIIYAPSTSDTISYNLAVSFSQHISQNTPQPFIPYCTHTPIPSNTPTPTLTPTPVTTCTFEANPIGYSIVFPKDTKIYATRPPHSVITDSLSIPPGFYSVSLASYDNHSTQTVPAQPHEQWYLQLYNAENTVVATSGVSEDIPDEPDDPDCLVSYLDEVLILSDTAVSAEAIHAFQTGTNSLYPDYALLIPARMVEPSPTRTPLPPHRLTQTPTPHP